VSTTVPAAVVLELRGALYHQLGSTAEDLASADYDPPADRLSEWSEPLARLDRARVLLDRIGWVRSNPETGAEIDLDRHRRVILDALGTDLSIQRSLAGERDVRASAHVLAIEAFAASADLDLDRDHEQRITVPDDTLDLLTRCLLSIMREAAELVEQCGFNGDDYAEPLERFDVIRAALDAIKWGARADIDVSAHRWALQLALTERLASERDAVRDALESIERDRKGGVRELQRARGYMQQIETLMTDAGLDIPTDDDA
jgi:hypothetical protein